MVVPRHPSGCGGERTASPEPAGGTGRAGGSGRDPAELPQLPRGLRAGGSVCQRCCEPLEPRLWLCCHHRARGGAGIAGQPGDALPGLLGCSVLLPSCSVLLLSPLIRV